MSGRSEQFSSESISAYQQYVQRLTDALKRRDWVADPDFALATDRQIYRKVMRDPVSAHAIYMRRHLVAGPDWKIEPASETDDDERAAGIVDDLLKNLRGFGDARSRLADSIFRGSAYAFIEGARAHRTVDGVLGSWWAPTRLKDVDRRRFRRAQTALAGGAQASTTEWQFWSIEREDWEPLEHPEWFVRCVFQDTEDSLGYGRGLLETLTYYQAAKSRVLQDYLAAGERSGQGFVTLGIESMRGDNGRPNGGTDRSADDVAEAWLTSFAKHRSRHGFVHDARDEVKVHTGFGEGHQLLKNLIDYLDAAQTMAVLGSTMPTQATTGGSFAMASVQADSTEALVMADRIRLGEELTDCLIGLMWRLNRQQLADAGLAAARMPRLTIVNKTVEDPRESAQVIATALASGIPLRKDEVYRQLGFSVPVEGDDVIEPGQAAGQGGLLGGIEETLGLVTEGGFSAAKYMNGGRG